MADIELVIKIPEEVKNRLCFGVTYKEDIQTVCEALNNGTPLPEHYGRLMDADEFYEQFQYCDYAFYETLNRWWNRKFKKMMKKHKR